MAETLLEVATAHGKPLDAYMLPRSSHSTQQNPASNHTLACPAADDVDLASTGVASAQSQASAISSHRVSLQPSSAESAIASAPQSSGSPSACKAAQAINEATVGRSIRQQLSPAASSACEGRPQPSQTSKIPANGFASAALGYRNHAHADDAQMLSSAEAPPRQPQGSRGVDPALSATDAVPRRQSVHSSADKPAPETCAQEDSAATAAWPTSAAATSQPAHASSSASPWRTPGSTAVTDTQSPKAFQALEVSPTIGSDVPSAEQANLATEVSKAPARWEVCTASSRPALARSSCG